MQNLNSTDRNFYGFLDSLKKSPSRGSRYLQPMQDLLMQPPLGMNPTKVNKMDYLIRSTEGADPLLGQSVQNGYSKAYTQGSTQSGKKLDATSSKTAQNLSNIYTADQKGYGKGGFGREYR